MLNIACEVHTAQICTKLSKVDQGFCFITVYRTIKNTTNVIPTGPRCNHDFCLFGVNQQS